jgi:general stress protein YciG
MDPLRQQEIARMGGKAAHAKGTAHEWSVEEARAAGRKGGRRKAKAVAAAKLKRGGDPVPAGDSAASA